jgi:hypothetical protein
VQFFSGLLETEMPCRGLEGAQGFSGGRRRMTQYTLKIPMYSDRNYRLYVVASTDIWPNRSAEW